MGRVDDLANARYADMDGLPGTVPGTPVAASGSYPGSPPTTPAGVHAQALEAHSADAAAHAAQRRELEAELRGLSTVDLHTRALTSGVRQTAINAALGLESDEEKKEQLVRFFFTRRCFLRADVATNWCGLELRRVLLTFLRAFSRRSR